MKTLSSCLPKIKERENMIECIRFVSCPKGYLLGFADFYIPKWDLEVFGFKLYSKEGNRWVNAPAREYINNEGEKKFAPYIRFREKEHYDTFLEQAKLAIDKWCAANSNTSSKNVGDVKKESSNNYYNDVPF